MPTKPLPFYLKSFEKLRRDEKMGGAPHKPVLLLSIIDQFAQRTISDNRIFITPELIAAFKINWAALVETEHTMGFALPFYHMRSEPFWRLVSNDGCEMWVESKAAMRRISNLQTAVHHAEIDLELAAFLKSPTERNLLKAALLARYFPKKGLNFDSNNEQSTLLKTIEQEMEKQSSADYQAILRDLKVVQNQGEFEEEVAIRGGLFKRKIPTVYGFSCCVSGFGISTNFNQANLIEACHIRPISQSFDDTLSNGIALCPTLHKAFDAGIFTLADDFKILVSIEISEKESPQSIGRFHGQKIKLPVLENHWPNRENLRWHRENVFQKGR